MDQMKFVGFEGGAFFSAEDLDGIKGHALAHHPGKPVLVYELVAVLKPVVEPYVLEPVGEGLEGVVQVTSKPTPEEAREAMEKLRQQSNAASALNAIKDKVTPASELLDPVVEEKPPEKKAGKKKEAAAPAETPEPPAESGAEAPKPDAAEVLGAEIAERKAEAEAAKPVVPVARDADLTAPETKPRSRSLPPVQPTPEDVVVSKFELWAQRVPKDSASCPRCGGELFPSRITDVPSIGDGGKIITCVKDGCYASLADQAHMHLKEDDQSNDYGKNVYRSLSLALQDAVRTGEIIPTETMKLIEGVVIPVAEEVSTLDNIFGVPIERCPEEWAHLEITTEGGESGGGQLKAVNTVLSEAGWSGGLRKYAAQALLEDPFIESIKELTKEQADRIMKFFEGATPTALSLMKKKADELAASHAGAKFDAEAI